MSNLVWQERRNIENSLAEFLQAQVSGLTVFSNGKSVSIDIRVGWSPRDDWKLPVISLYHDSRTAVRGFIGQNKRLNTHLIIINIRALDDGMRSDLSDWVTDTINNGFDYNVYTPDTVTPNTANKVLTGKISVEFVSDIPIRADGNVDAVDKFRHNISFNATITI